ncbi:TetR/AcrR family transcriptional regulator [bacterium]|nr:MAG: TetR/AcrR family transcriptional regulator [bacterium]
MTVITKKEKEKELRRIQILNAVDSLLKEKSFESITMDEIAEKVELSKGTLYLYFASKKELSLAIHNRSLEIVSDRFARVLALDFPGNVLLKKMAEQYIDYIEQNPRVMELFLQNEMLLFPNVETAVQICADENTEAFRCHDSAARMFSYLIRAIQVGMADGSIVYKGDAKELAVLYWGGVKGIFQISYLYERGFVLSSLEGMDLSYKSNISNFLNLLESAITKK